MTPVAKSPLHSLTTGRANRRRKLVAMAFQSQKEKLRLAQDVWFRFREANADFQGTTAEGEPLAPLLKMSTLADITEARTAELKKELSQYVSWETYVVAWNPYRVGRTHGGVARVGGTAAHMPITLRACAPSNSSSSSDSNSFRYASM